MVGWSVGRQDFSKTKASRRAGCKDPGGNIFLRSLAGRLASQPCIWLPPPSLGIYYWYWYITGHIFLIMGGVFLIMGGIAKSITCVAQLCNIC